MRCGLQSPPCFLAYCGALWLMALRSSHCRITAGLASMDRPHLLSLSSVGSVRGYTAPVGWLRGAFPSFAYCPTSRVPSGSLLQVSRQVFAMGSPFWVESVSVLDQNEVSSSTFLVLSWSLRDGVTLSGRGCPRSRSERRLFAHLL